VVENPAPLDEPVQDATPTAEPAPQGIGPTLEGTAPITDVDGYTLTIDFSLTPLRIDQEVANEKPGFSTARLAVGGQLTMQNTTPGREITFENDDFLTDNVGLAKFAVVGVWSPESIVCTYATGEPPEVPCAVLMAYTDVTTLAPDTTPILMDIKSGWYGIDAGLAQVPDATYEQVTTALARPEAYYVLYAGKDNDRFVGTCPVPSLDEYLENSWTGAMWMWNNGLIPVWSSNGTCTETKLSTQPT
jgi:hypothetical protein